MECPACGQTVRSIREGVPMMHYQQDAFIRADTMCSAEAPVCRACGEAGEGPDIVAVRTTGLCHGCTQP